MKKVPAIIQTMYSPDLFLPESRINVFSVETGQWAGYIVHIGEKQFQATRMNGTGAIFEDEEGARWFIRNPKAQAPIIFEEEEIINPLQTSLFL